ncbi:MAG: DUF3291 domain-containing protein [Caulobacteraceae bacterium]
MFVSLTRLRLRRLWFVPGFIRHAGPAFRQAQAAPGFRDGSVLRDRQLTFWTMTAWNDAESMRAYMLSGAHQKAMPRFANWCDEGSVAHWEEAGGALPSWPEAERRMRAQGRPSKLRYPSPNHADLSFRPARTTTSAPMPRAARLAESAST